MFFRKKSPKEIEEYQARGELQDVYHDITQVLRLSGVNLIFRQWAATDKEALEHLWYSLRPVLRTSRFEEASDELRKGFAEEAAPLAKKRPVHTERELGESQEYQIRRALNVYHYALPKLLLLVATARRVLEDDHVFRPQVEAVESELIMGGVPKGMFPMEMVSSDPADRRLRRAFKEIKKTFHSDSVNSLYRTLGLWPEYLLQTWRHHKRILTGRPCEEARSRLNDRAGQAAELFRASVDVRVLRETVPAGTVEELRTVAARIQSLIPLVGMDVCLHLLAWQDAAQLAVSPFPAEVYTPGKKVIGAV